jgi:radical SAM superfamily enzyme YgiQ (UPF0313 family)
LIRFTDWAFNKALSRFKPDIVGFTGYTHESSTVKRLAKLTKKKLPKARIIVGGHHATVAPQDYNLEEIDGIVRGEGSQAFRAFVDAVAAGKELVGIPGVIATGQHFTEPTEWPEFPDPAQLPIPRRDLWDYRHYYSVWAAEKMPKFHTLFPPVAMVRTSWGCKMKCSFCIVPYLCGGMHRPRPIESIVDEIESLQAQHIYFSDDENFINVQFAWELAEAIEKRGIKKRYFAWTRATTVNHNPELMQKWRNIGLDSAFLGFEFIDNQELKKEAKASTVAINEKALNKLRSMNVVVHAAFMVRPEYTQEKFHALREYVRAMPPSQCSFTVIAPSPGTPDYKKMEPDIWVSNPYDIYDCMHPLTKTVLPLRQFSEEYALLAAEGLSKTPLRVNRHVPPPADMIRILRAESNYRKGFRKIYRDYPRELWDSS